jgi:hypothetical protein
MKSHRLWALGVLLLLTAVAAPAALAAPVTVNLRIEGASSTIFEGPVTTDAKTIAGHPCDGTNGGQNPSPGPTMTSALDDASLAHGFTWSGTWFDGFDDFGIDRIGPDASNSSQFWGYALNFTPTSIGGCQQQVKAGDEVLFGFDFFSKQHLLKLSGPNTAPTGTPVTVNVVDGQDSSAMSGATVGGKTTGADGNASLTFTSPGIVHLKAERSDSVRSNALDLCVYAPGSGDCSSFKPPTGGVGGATSDRLPPAVAIAAIHNGARFRRGHGPRKLSGSASDGGGLFQVYFRLERHTRAGCQWYSSKRSVFTHPASDCDSARFQRVGTNARWSYLLPKKLGPGRYTLESKAIDKAYNGARTRVTFRVQG